MYRSQIVRISRTSFPMAVSSRAYNVTPPPAGQPTPNSKAKQYNTLVYTTLGLAAAAGAYYYFRNTDEAQALKDKAKADHDQMKRRSLELTDAVRARAENVKQQGQAKLDQVKTESKGELDSVRSTAEREAKGGLAANLEAKYDSAKGSAKENLARARDSTENLYNEAKTESKKAKNGWFSWLNWGKSEADDIESEAERK